MITLYHSPDSRSSRFLWLLEEIGEPYEVVYCSIARRAGGTEDARNVRRAAYLVWLAFYAGEVDPVYITRWLYGECLDPITLRDQARVVNRVSGALREGPYLLGQQFTAADILVSGPFEWDRAWAPDNPYIQQWLARLNSRPAAQRAAAKDKPTAHA